MKEKAEEILQIEIPRDVDDLYLSGLGYLCCYLPHRYVLFDNPFLGYHYEKMEQKDGKLYAILIKDKK